VKSISSVDIKVCISKTKTSELIIFEIGGSSIFAIANPYITNDILFPTSIVAIYCSELDEKIFNILAVIVPFCFSTSKLILFDDTNAISIPEKKNENTIVIIMITTSVIYIILQLLSKLFL